MTQINKYTKDGSTAYMFNAYVGRHPKTGKMFIVSDKDLKKTSTNCAC